MATLGDLKTRVILETNRDDLAEGEESEAALTGAIDRAIEYYADEKFYFNRDSGTAITTSGTGYVVCPYAVRVPETVSYNGTLLAKVPFDSISYLTLTGQPTRWAENGGLIQLSPIPDAAYSLTVHGIAQIDAPEDDGDETVWTNEAYDLIVARVRFLLYRDVFRDKDGAQLAAQAEGEALTRLRKETRRRSVTPLRSRGDEPWSASTSNINTGN
jgi:hypothetical protein